MMWKSLIVAGAVATALTAQASAQISGQSGPIQIEADQLNFLDRQGRAVYVGNVDAIQGDARIRAEKLTIFFEQNENADNSSAIGGSVGAVQRMVAEGEVYYMTPGERAKGDRGEYNYRNDTITLTGNVTLTRGENVIVGDELVVDLANGRSTVTSEGRTQGTRVRTVIVTEGNEASE